MSGPVRELPRAPHSRARHRASGPASRKGHRARSPSLRILRQRTTRRRASVRDVPRIQGSDDRRSMAGVPRRDLGLRLHLATTLRAPSTR